jgi:hypothetical protein
MPIHPICLCSVMDHYLPPQLKVSWRDNERERERERERHLVLGHGVTLDRGGGVISFAGGEKTIHYILPLALSPIHLVSQSTPGTACGQMSSSSSSSSRERANLSLGP